MRALVIDDAPFRRRQLVDALARRGHAVACAPDPRSGWSMHREAPFDLMVVDWAAPEEGASDLCRRVRSLTSSRDVAILAITDRGRPGDAAAALAVGVTDCIQKPFEDDQLGLRLMVVERETLRRSATAFRTLSESSPEAIAVHRGGTLLYVNPTLVRFLGYGAPPDLVARGLDEVVHPEDRAALRAHPGEGGFGGSARLRLMRRDGEPLPVDVWAMRIAYEGVPAVLLRCRDMVARDEMHARLMLADRMASVGTLAAGVAHELNNPLAYALSNVRLLREELEAPGDVAADRVHHMRELVDEAVHGIERMRAIVRDLKTFSRMDDERHQVVEVARIVRSCLSMCSNELRHRATLAVDLVPTSPVCINESRLAQVVLNLLINAAQALPEGADHAHRISVRTRESDGFVMVEVADSGQGIAPDDMGRIFDPFYTTKGLGVGTGLGLCVCRNIISAAGGDVDVESEPGRGTTFRVLLPAAAGQRASPPSSPRPPVGAEGEAPRLLVIDDEPMVGRSIRRVLRGHDVTVVSDGREAVDMLTSNGARFDLVLCDLMMPGMSGMDVFGAVTIEKPELADRFVFMTGGAFTAGARTFLDQVTNDHIEKPFDPHRVRALVRERTRG